MAWKLTTVVDGVKTVQTCETKQEAKVLAYHFYSQESHNMKKNVKVEVREEWSFWKFLGF